MTGACCFVISGRGAKESLVRKSPLAFLFVGFVFGALTISLLRAAPSGAAPPSAGIDQYRGWERLTGAPHLVSRSGQGEGS